MTEIDARVRPPERGDNSQYKAAAGCEDNYLDLAPLLCISGTLLAELCIIVFPADVVLSPNLVLTTHHTTLVAVRWASKKSGGSSKNLGGRSPGKRYGFKKVEGAFVHAGNILATQRLIPPLQTGCWKQVVWFYFKK
uniref:Uncharacterized protein n=1 Tax=Serinus canaria TaxID=9135 RepID=A0A8C9L1S3_SERCA